MSMRIGSGHEGSDSPPSWLGRPGRSGPLHQGQFVTANLLDTSTALIALTEPRRLRATALAAVKAGPNVLSVVTWWEVILKSMKGALDVSDLRAWWSDALDQLAAKPLALRPEHLGELSTLSPHHKDPFDRMLIAQAIVEGLSLMTIR